MGEKPSLIDRIMFKLLWTGRIFEPIEWLLLIIAGFCFAFLIWY